MKFQTLMIIKAVVCLALGVPILLMPGLIYSIFGITLGPGGAVAAREYGAALIGTLMITWFARNAPVSDVRWAIALGYCTYDLVGFVVSVAATLTGVMNLFGWSVVVIYLFFTLGFGYFTIKSHQPVMQIKTT
jgi:hypothetical protein